MTLRTISDVADAYEAGRFHTGLMRRAGPASVAGYWQDFSYAAGIPSANFYAATPITKATLSANDGILHGPDVNPTYKKYLHKVLLVPPSTSVGLLTAYIHDIVCYYPFVDGDGGFQTMLPLSNHSTTRYNGVGCKIMLVSQGAGLSASGSTTIVYVDSNDTTQTITGISTQHVAPAGTLLTNQPDAVVTATTPSPYIECPTGIKRIVSFDFDIGVGGIFAAVIVKPLGVVSIAETGTPGVPVEVDFIRERLAPKEVEDGAYISMIYRATVSASPTNTMAELTFIWN